MIRCRYHNIQGYIWQRLYHEMFESLGQRTWLQSRGGYAGTQAYPTNSYSDVRTRWPLCWAPSCALCPSPRHSYDGQRTLLENLIVFAMC